VAVFAAIGEILVNSTTCTTHEKIGGTATDHELRGSTTYTTEKNNNPHEHAEKIN
jgi:hypothetical protein